MKKLINDPFAVVDEAIQGFAAAHAEIVAVAAERVVARSVPARDKVGIVVGGGSGHEPAFVGYFGVGLADAAAIGNVFASPSADVVLSAIHVADHGCGVLMLYGNYAGDVLNFGLAAQLAEADGIAVREVRVSDDVASARPDEVERRRGIAGDIIVFKCAGAAAEAGATLEEVLATAQKANSATRSMGVALSPCQVPGAPRPTFELAADEIEIGMGVHGEPGIRRGKLQTANEIADALVAAIVTDMPADHGTDVALLVNGLGATAYLDQYVLYGAARDALAARGLAVTRSLVGEYITSLEMAGASITVTLLDDELTALLDAPSRAVRSLP
jgi:dihydroxyacetone kinase